MDYYDSQSPAAPLDCGPMYAPEPPDDGGASKDGG
jgi:hypothetical protein